MRADGRRIVSRVLLVGCLKRPRQLLGLRREFGTRLEFDIHIRLRALLRARRSVVARHAVVEQHHVVLDHAEPGGLGVPARSRRILLALQRLALLDVCAGAVETRLFIVPKDEPDGPIGPDIGSREDAGELHDERGA